MGDSTQTLALSPYALARASQKDVLEKKNWENMVSLEKELLQIMNVCNYTQFTLIFTSVIHAMSRFKRVNKSDECFF